VVLTVPAVQLIAVKAFNQMFPLPEATFAPRAIPPAVLLSVTAPLPLAEMLPLTVMAPPQLMLIAALPPEVERLGAPAVTVTPAPLRIDMGLENVAVVTVTAPAVAFPMVMVLKPATRNAISAS
jgi:hypothetical protein